jgi:hypothetical protein
MKIRLARYVVRMGEKRFAKGVSVGKPEGKRPLGRPRHRLEAMLKWILEK